MFRVTVMTNTASSGKRSEGTAGCGVDGLERMEIMPLPGKQMRNSVGTRSTRIAVDKRPSSGPNFSHSELPKSLTVLFEIRRRVVEDFVLV
jgi:hypothetical protein